MSQIILTKGVKEYRQTIKCFVNRHDVVLEIGFAWGTTTKLLSQVCKKVVGIDKGMSYHKAVKMYPELELYKIDAFNIREVIALGYNFNKIYIDISGCRDIYSVIKVVKMYEKVFNPKIIVVKSTKLKDLVNRCIVWNAKGSNPQ